VSLILFIKKQGAVTLFIVGLLVGIATAYAVYRDKDRSIIDSIAYIPSTGSMASSSTATTSVPISSGAKDDAELLSKIDQLFIIGFRGVEYSNSPELKRALAETNLGGIILFDYDTPSKKYVRNIQDFTQVQTLISDAQAKAKHKLIVAIDEEGGLVSRLKSIPGYTKTPSAKALGTMSDAKVEQTASDLASTLKKLGFNMNFAPVLDVNVNPSNPVIGKVDRSFSSDEQVVVSKGLAFYRGLQKQGIISAVKHFPGHGSSQADTHLGFVDISSSYKAYELEPFKSACSAGVPMVMVGHLFNKNVDAQYPTTLSKKHIDVLKKDAGCTTQVVVSDDMDMGAITKLYGKKEALTRAINAGVDILVISNNIGMYNPREFFDARKIVFDQVKAGAISKSRIDEAYKAIQHLKETYLIY
jgi:beta-N-acetylhexosaminidase